ncbi:hypothetical protein [Salinarimonas rosea]|uniref:hypothetical protein n=1 Tax=Salinarimonas rosea TaxID=552063 RepID=UPI0004221002|nr:hypothetical protein [Salinarimonas rosea]
MAEPSASPDRGAERAARLWSEAQPLLVGITGQRFFDRTSAAGNAARAQIVEGRLAAVFARLDADFPDTPKLLLTGAAMGSDLIAARVARRTGPLWRVAAILPFARDLFREDFEPPPGVPDAERAAFAAWCDGQREDFEALVAAPEPEVLVRVLPSLAGSGPLSRRANGYDRVDRHAHYEQVGQWIAEAATLLVAVAEAGAAEAEMARRAKEVAGDAAEVDPRVDGNTTRVLATRRHGLPDTAGRAVAQRSSVLRRDWSPVLPPPSRSAWLIDPTEPWQPERRRFGAARTYPVRSLRPEEPPPPGGHEKPLPPTVEADHPSLRLARAFDRYGREVASRTATPARADERAIAVLERVRGTLSGASRLAKRPSEGAFWALALLFVAAVAVYETFAKFRPGDPIVLIGYLVLLLAIGAVALLAGRLRWQPRAEDYRAVAEMLRVQIAWWSAGSPERVDRKHLQGVDRDIARIRDGVTGILTWIWLRRARAEAMQALPLEAEWNRVRGGTGSPRTDLRELPKPPGDWIGSPLWYFERNAEARETHAARAERQSWFLVVGSGVLAALLFFWLGIPSVKKTFEAAGALLGWSGVVGGIVVTVAIAAARDVLSPRFRGFRSVLVSLGFAVPAAAALGLAAAGLGHALVEAGFADMSGSTATKYAAIVLVVLLNAVAGAWRYLAEKLGWEAEALAYRDAYRAFHRAEEALAALWDEASGRPRAGREDEARAIVHELGRVALIENEAWLKTRRERPLTPVAG